MNESTILLISDSDLIYKTLLDNLKIENATIHHIEGSKENIKNFLNQYHKSIVTIIDSGAYYNNDICKFSKYLFSFDLIPNALIFRKPFALLDLVQAINNSISDTKLFNILDNIVYNEKTSKIILSNDESISLTAKENAIMRHLILSPNCILSQNFLLQNIWKYSPNTETTTISAHINTLRAKLPSSMIENTSDGLKLYVENLF